MKNSPFNRRPHDPAEVQPTSSITSADGTDAPEFNLQQEIADLLKLTRTDGSPNVNALTELLRDFTAMKFNMKFYGYDIARKLAEGLPPLPVGGPFEIDLESKASTQTDLEADWSRHWSSELQIAHVFHRKIWELSYTLQALWQTGMMAAGRRGLGFGCGEEPLPSYLAAQGCDVTITDLAPDDQRSAGWANTSQNATLDKAYKSEFLSRDVFDQRSSFRHVDMTAIPDDLRDYDFCWSICAFEHLGSIEKGIRFIEDSMDVLKSGGISIHTTEFNFMNETETLDNCSTVLFQRRHFEEMARRLEAKGYQVAPLNFDVGSKPMDKFIDIAPFVHDWKFDQAESWSNGTNHLKVAADGIPSTCFGIISFKP